MKRTHGNKALVLRNLALALLLTAATHAGAQGIKSQRSYTDGTKVITTDEVRFGKAGGVFSRTCHLGMSHITFGEDGSTTFAILLPLNTPERLTIPVGNRLTLLLSTGEELTLLNVRNISRGDNHVEFDRTYTVRPEFAVTDEELRKLEMLRVTGLRVETDSRLIEILCKDYPRKWEFNKMLQRCHDVLRWKLAEKK